MTTDDANVYVEKRRRCEWFVPGVRLFLPTFFFPSLPQPALPVFEFPWSEAARDLRVPRRLLAGTQRLNFRCNWLTAITFHQFEWKSVSIKYLRVARRSPSADREIPVVVFFPSSLYLVRNRIIDLTFYPFTYKLICSFSQF